jgi:hypothetical protein
LAISSLLSTGCLLVIDDTDTDNASSDDSVGSTGETSGGDGDGTETGDGDGTPSCGWGPTGDSTITDGYVCGGAGEDPDGTWTQACPDGLVEGEACGTVTGVGCCDPDGNAWFCGTDGTTDALFKEDCSAAGDGDGDGDGDGSTT